MIINFACTKVELESIVRCGFGLKKTEYAVLTFLLGHDKNLRITEIARAMHKERTTIQKVVKSLVEKELVKRGQVNLKSGGYVFVYSAIDKNILKKKTIAIIQEWVKSAENAINGW
jgi:predicted transcriptional regulator